MSDDTRRTPGRSRSRGRVVLERAGRAYRWWALRRRRASPDAVLQIAMRQVRRTRYALVITEHRGQVRARVVEPFAPSRDGTIRFGTDPSSRKVLDIRRTGRCLLTYQDDRRRSYVTVECAARVEDWPVTGHPRFMATWTAFWPAGPTPQEYVVVACEPRALEMWHGTAVVGPPPFGRRAHRLEHVDGVWREASAAAHP